MQKYELFFEWCFAPAGYRWEDLEPCDFWGLPFSEWETDKRNVFENTVQRIPSGPFLIENDTNIIPYSWEPMDDPLLFAEFADVKGEAQALAEWASSNGRLIDVDNDLKNYIFIYPEFHPLDVIDEDCDDGIGEIKIQDSTTEKDISHYRAKADPLDFWLKEHKDLSNAVLIWELANNHDPRLGVIYRLEKDQHRYLSITDQSSGELLGQVDFSKLKYGAEYKAVYPLPQESKPDGLVVIGAEFFLTEELEDKLEILEVASDYLQHMITSKLAQYPLQVAFEKDDKGKLYKTICPTSLLSAMWYQFFLAQTGEIRLRRCAICGKWENMEGHRSTWSMHANCANYGRVKRAREKKKSTS